MNLEEVECEGVNWIIWLRIRTIGGDKPIEQISVFKYFGYNINLNHFNMKLSNFKHICNALKRTLGCTERTETVLKSYKIMVVRTLLYG
jgi:hypothetical protein